jgi:lipopolysaccharide transport system ATP-binding protein
MSSKDIAVSVRGVSKSYTIAHNEERHVTLAETLLARARNPLKRAKRETFWALNDVSFDIRKGDVVGIIGRNGAGKSTLLKILSRITEPTKGEIEVRGRIGSLLEVGTGFHPELTGRENVFLNGAILGMSKAEIRKQFDAIVEFAGVEKFLDTPVKRYSSGMYVRLAFAVAAHLRTEILIVDEVLSVGDSEFQRKCLGKMKDVASLGRTVLLVSHNMAAVSNLCGSALLMKAGGLKLSGPCQQVIEHYIAGEDIRSERTDLNAFRPFNAKPVITQAAIINERGQAINILPLGSNIKIEMSFDAGRTERLRHPVMGVVLNHATLGTVGGVNMLMTDSRMQGGPHGHGTIACTLVSPPLIQGNYTVDLWLSDGAAFVDRLDGFLRLTIEDADVYGTGRVPYNHLGVMYFIPSWQFSDGSSN